MTLMVSKTNIPPDKIKKSSLCKIKAEIAKSPTELNDPESPIKILLGYILKVIKPRVAPKEDIKI